MTKRIIFHLGNFLIIVSLIGFAYTFYPLIRAYAPVASAKQEFTQKGMYINIPKIQATAPVIKDVNPWDERVYLQTLKKGVAHAAGTSLPGQNGTIFLFAHSSGAPWDITWSNTIFLRLNELQIKDKIEIIDASKKYLFEVRDKKIVRPEEVSYLLNTNKDQLILQTCTPPGTSLNRLLIFAESGISSLN